MENLVVGSIVHSGPRTPVRGFSITVRQAKLGRTPLDE
jgi:hypothetical protein